MAEQFILIPGRSSRQGVALNEGKYTEGYLDETSTLRMNPNDMQRLGMKTGDEVRMWNDVGEVVVPCLDAKDECPEGLVFICYGDKSSQLMAGETHGSGMPDSKGLDVFLQMASLPKPETPGESKAQVPPDAADPKMVEVVRPPAPIRVEAANDAPVSQPDVPVPDRSTKPETLGVTTTHPPVRERSGLGPTIALVVLVIVLAGLTAMMGN